MKKLFKISALLLLFSICGCNEEELSPANPSDLENERSEDEKPVGKITFKAKEGA